ncbi:hypothetical protein [Enhygromyxa salina]|nr:hypothetical protein [Enhygromyxa salina]
MADDFEARLDALVVRIDDSLARTQRWIDPIVRVVTDDVDGELPRPVEREARGSAEVEELRAKLRAAESSAALQAQRCAALEDKAVELEAALVGARDQRAHAEATAEAARREANQALDQLEAARSSNSETAGGLDPSFGEAFQEKLLEIERLTRERDSLRRSSDEWRGRARTFRRERDEATLAHERAESQLEELRGRDAALRRKLGDAQKTMSEQQRELELAERRAKHLREHFKAAPR